MYQLYHSAILRSAHTVRLCVLRGSPNKQLTAVTYRFL